MSTICTHLPGKTLRDASFVILLFDFLLQRLRKSMLGLVHTMLDKFESATLRAKTEQMFCVHTRAF